jgi:DNA-binding transcriptional regulator GbsR (MarR family)
MAKKQDWKIKALRILPPRLFLGAYRDVIDTINGLENKVFTLGEVSKKITEWSEDLDPLHLLAVERDRCIKILPTVIGSLTEAGLLLKRDRGRFKKSEDFGDFWYLTKKVRTSVEKAIRWGVYYVMARGGKKGSFSCHELIDALTSSYEEIVDVLDRLAIPRQGKWKKILQEKEGRWIIKEKLPLRAGPPSVVKDISDKILYALSLFSESGATEVSTDKIVEKVRSSDVETIEKFLTRLHFEKRDSQWFLPHDTKEAPQELIEKIEVPGRLPAGQAAYTCIHLLDSAHLSATEIVEITGIDKSTISRALKKLGNEDLIELTRKKGPFGEVYYTTNCDNCGFGKDKEECRDEVISEVKKLLKDHELILVDVDWSGFSNQTLNRLAQDLTSLKAEKSVKHTVRERAELWDVLLKPRLAKIMESMEKRAVAMNEKEDWIDVERVYELIDEKGKDLPLLYFLGVKHVLESASIRRGWELFLGEKARSE